jgi:hypothetical protein
MTTTITREKHAAVTRDVEQALASVFEKHGLDLRIKGGTYGPSYAIKIEGILRAEDDGAAFNPNSPEAQYLAQFAEVYGLPADALGREFTSRGRRFVVTGLNTRARRMPIQAKCLDDDRNYKFEAEAVARALSA